MSRHFIRLSYEGTTFHGWQAQPHENSQSVQSVLEDSFYKLLKTEVDFVGCGRTDTGVHAKNYFAHFDIVGLSDIDTLIYKLNKLLPPSIVVHSIFKVNDQAHARFDAISRSYTYSLHVEKNPFIHQSYFYKYGIPNIDILNEAASILVKYQDFITFCKVNHNAKTTLCTIKEVKWELINGSYNFHITSDRFLRGMIRLVVGMCLNVDRKKISISQVEEALQNKKKLTLDWSVPAEGLTLHNVLYPYKVE